MKAASLALACALLGATALAPASFAQTSTGTPQTTPQTPAEASPSTSSPDASMRTGTQAQRDWRDQDGRTGGWRSSRDDDDDERFSSRDTAGRYAHDDDDDEDDMSSSRGRYGDMGRGMGHGMGHGMGYGMSREGMGEGMREGMGRRMTPAMMRMHMQMMRGQRGARLSLKRGDSQIDIRCPANENITACVDAVGKLMDRLQAMPQTPR